MVIHVDHVKRTLTAKVDRELPIFGSVLRTTIQDQACICATDLMLVVGEGAQVCRFLGSWDYGLDAEVCESRLFVS
jgi:hypothetical protein